MILLVQLKLFIGVSLIEFRFESITVRNINNLMYFGIMGNIA